MQSPRPPDEVIAFYARGLEEARLRAAILDFVRATEAETSLLGASSHLLIAARAPTSG